MNISETSARDRSANAEGFIECAGSAFQGRASVMLGPAQHLLKSVAKFATSTSGTL
jgi:hypothetical protein